MQNIKTRLQELVGKDRGNTLFVLLSLSKKDYASVVLNLRSVDLSTKEKLMALMFHNSEEV